MIDLHIEWAGGEVEWCMTDNIHDDDPPEVETGVPELEEPPNTDEDDDVAGEGVE